MARFKEDQYQLRRSLVRKTTLFAVLFSLVMFGFGLNGRDATGEIQAQADDITATLMTYASMPARGFEKTLVSLSNLYDLHEENERLKAEISRLSRIENEDLALREQVSYLETILNTTIDIGGERGQVAARAVSENDGPFTKSALINAGQSKGIKKGQAVLTEDGMYGRIVRHGKRSARVLLLNDLNSRISVMSLRSRSRAILAGENTNVPQLDFRGDGDWQIGDKVITSGDDGSLPRGLPIGQVIAIDNAKLGVELYTNKAPVDWVEILLYEPMQSPEIDPADPELEAVALEANAETDTDLSSQAGNE